MNIPITPEDDPQEPFEHCIFCATPTAYWYIPANRPVCPVCSVCYNVSQIKSAPYNY